MSVTQAQRLGMAGGTFLATWGMVQHGGEGAIIGAVLASVVASNADRVIGWFAGEKSPQPVVDGDYPTEEEIAEYRRLQAAGSLGQTEDFTNWENDLEQGAGQQDRGVFFFSELLKTGWRPSWNEIFVGRTMQGKDVFVPALDLCHVAFSGKTGGGKGSLMRLIMVQLCYVGAPVALLNPHYMRWVKAKEGDAFDEDWSPFEGTNPQTNKPYLEKSPLACAEVPMIDGCLTWAVETLLESRKLRARTQKVNFVPYFIVIDEWPLLIKRLGKRASELLGYLLREGRKYRIYVIIASQDFQVKTMGCEGEGSVRKCLLTVFYTGGDITTRRELLNEETRDTPENKIGKGVVLMRCTGTDNEVILARVPFVDNEAVYMLLGESTYEQANDLGEEELGDDPLNQAALVSDAATEVPSGQPRTARTVAAGVEPEVARSEQAPEDRRVYLGKDSATGQDVTITREEYRMAVNMRRRKLSTGHRDLMDVLSLSEHHAKTLNTMIRKELGLDVKGEREREAEKEVGREGVGEGE